MPQASNLFLASLSEADFDALRPHLKAIELPQGTGTTLVVRAISP